MAVSTASIVLGVSETTVRRWFHAGKLQGTQNFATNEILLNSESVNRALTQKGGK